MSSDASLSPFTTEELTSLLDIVKPSSGVSCYPYLLMFLMTSADDARTPEYNVCIIGKPLSPSSQCDTQNFREARLMSLLSKYPASFSLCAARLTCEPAYNKFVNFHGKECERLDADMYVFGEDRWENHIIFQIMNICMFLSLKVYALRLRRVWRWKEFVTRMMDELSRYAILVRAVYLFSTPFLTNE